MKVVIWLAYWLALFLITDLMWMEGWFFEITGQQIAYLSITPVVGGIFYEQSRKYISKRTTSSAWKNRYIESIYSSLLWIIVWGFAFLIERDSGFLWGVRSYIYTLSSIMPNARFLPVGSCIPIGGLVFPWVHHLISKRKTKRTNMTLFYFSSLIIGIFLWFCCMCFLNYALPCGDSCTPTHYHDSLFSFAVMYSIFFPLFLVPILALLLLESLLINLFLFLRDKSNLQSHG